MTVLLTAMTWHSSCCVLSQIVLTVVVLSSPAQHQQTASRHPGCEYRQTHDPQRTETEETRCQQGLELLRQFQYNIMNASHERRPGREGRESLWLTLREIA